MVINVNASKSYDIEIGRNLLSKIGEDILKIKSLCNVCIVTDDIVASLYGDIVFNSLKKAGYNVCMFTIPHGEKSKNIKSFSEILEYLASQNFKRNDLIVALGGGVVGDLTGFAAATFLRGIDFIQIPTTLLSQVDSSVGGKTGVDFKGYKNMIGAFYMPRLVYMNIGTLSTLDDNNFACGMGEVIKSALIADNDFYEWLKSKHDLISSKDYEALSYAVNKCCQIKGHIVEIDPKEKGIRAYLNFGHTLGHAIEKLCNFSLGHGQCVSLGMVSALYLSEKLGNITSSEILDAINMLREYNLPVAVQGLDDYDVLAASKSDKKMADSKIKFIVLKNIGEADSYMDFSDEDLVFAINKVLE